MIADNNIPEDDDKIDLPPDKRPEEGIAYICKKAKLALIFV